jgi:hypothetical protein
MHAVTSYDLSYPEGETKPILVGSLSKGAVQPVAVIAQGSGSVSFHVKHD